MANSQAPVLELRDIGKSYGAVHALRGVSLALNRGEVHALLGDNGAGKSTLLQVAAGAIAPDEGEIRFHGKVLSLASPLDARDHGIETVYQDLALAEERSSAANVFVGRELVRGGPLCWLGILDRRRMRSETRSGFARLSIPVTDVDRPVRRLSGGQRQGVAIARAAMWAKGVVLLDEPTAALGVRQRGAVGELVRSLRERGLAVLLVSHDVQWVLKLADQVTVLRLGTRVATRQSQEIDISWVVGAMVGQVT